MADFDTREMWQRSGLTASEDPDIRQVQEFLWELRGLLQDVVLVDNLRAIVPGRHHWRLKAAWDYLQNPEKPSEGDDRHGFSWLVMMLDGTGAPGERDVVHKKLREAGLTGPLLDFKLGVYRHARDDYNDIAAVARTQSQPKSFWPKKLKRLFGRVLKSAGTLLGSIPGAEYAQEFVEILHSAIEA